MDIHRQKAAEMFGVPAESVTPEQRSAAKTASFGELHGKSKGELFAAMIRTARTKAQQRQYRLRGTLGALHMLPLLSPTAEDTTDWETLIGCRNRILARAKQRSIIYKFRTRKGNLRYPAWDSIDGIDHAFFRGQSLCGGVGTSLPRQGIASEQPSIFGPLPERTCPYCAGLALVGGVLQGQSGRRAALRGLYEIPAGAYPRWFLAGEEIASSQYALVRGMEATVYDTHIEAISAARAASADQQRIISTFEVSEIRAFLPEEPKVIPPDGLLAVRLRYTHHEVRIRIDRLKAARWLTKSDDTDTGDP